jgi:hypothetical protein
VKERKVTYEEAQKRAQECDLPYFEVSSKESLGIQEVKINLFLTSMALVIQALPLHVEKIEKQWSPMAFNICGYTLHLIINYSHLLCLNWRSHQVVKAL